MFQLPRRLRRRSKLRHSGAEPTRFDPELGRPWRAEIQFSTVAAGFCHFFTGFFIWALGPMLATDIGNDLGFTDLETKLIPISSLVFGASTRFMLGFLTDARGPFFSGTLSLTIALVPLIALSTIGSSRVVVWPSVALLGIGLAALSVSMPMTSRRTSPRRRGVALGLISSGSVGMVLAALVAPFLADIFNWRAVFGFAIIPTVLTLFIFVWGSRGPWTPSPHRAWRQMARSSEFRTVVFLLGITFGSFAGLYSFLPAMLRDVRLDYNLSAFEASLIVGIGALTGGAARIGGGFLADRYGGLSVLPYAIAGAAALLVVAGSLPLIPALVSFVLIMALFDGGTGAVLKLSAQSFGVSVGTGAGIAGAFGGVIAFIAAFLLIAILDATGMPAAAFGVLGAMSAATATWLLLDRQLQRQGTKFSSLSANPRLHRLDSYGRPTEMVEIGTGLSIGRAPGNRLLLADDDLVSRNHATVQVEDGRFWIRDHHSTNGTTIWRDKHWQPADTVENLADGDIIVIGTNVFQFFSGPRPKGEQRDGSP